MISQPPPSQARLITALALTSVPNAIVYVSHRVAGQPTLFYISSRCRGITDSEPGSLVSHATILISVQMSFLLTPLLENKELVTIMSVNNLHYEQRELIIGKG